MMMPLSKNDPQGYGSAITYARRYALSSLVGIITENDDDAESACNRGNGKQLHQGKNQKAPSQFPKPLSSPLLQNESSEKSSINQNGLPVLDGVQYQSFQTQEGRECVYATGDTMSKKQILKEAGFRWSAENKFWWKYADAKAA